MKKRVASETRKTRETDIAVSVNLDGKGKTEVETGLPFLNHMVELLSRHSLIDMKIRASGDLDVDYHHTVEDLGLTLGTALDKALGERAGITRYGWSLLPMDDSLARVAVDLGGRPYLVFQMANRKKKIRDFDLLLVEEFLRAFVMQARMNLHIQQLYGKEPHHAYEAVFKALAKALRQACAPDPRSNAIPSTKGAL